MRKLIAVLTFSSLAVSQSIFSPEVLKGASPTSEEGIDQLVLPAVARYYEGQCGPLTSNLCRFAPQYVKHCLNPLISGENLEKVAEWAVEKKSYACKLSLLYKLKRYEDIVKEYGHKDPLHKEDEMVRKKFLYGIDRCSPGALIVNPSLHGYLYDSLLIARSFEKVGNIDMAKRYYSFLLYSLKYPLRGTANIPVFPYHIPKETDWVPFLEKKVNSMGYEYYLEYLKDGLKWIEDCKRMMEEDELSKASKYIVRADTPAFKELLERHSTIKRDTEEAYATIKGYFQGGADGFPLRIKQKWGEANIMRYESEMRAEFSKLTQRR